MQNYRGTFINKNRDAWVEINLANLEHNILEVKNFLNNNCKTNPELFAVVKADGYGHGSLMCAPVLNACGVNCYGVASIDEGIELRTKILSKYVKNVKALLMMTPKEAREDVLDALCLAISAKLGVKSIPENPQKDSFGLKMQILVENVVGM